MGPSVSLFCPRSTFPVQISPRPTCPPRFLASLVVLTPVNFSMTCHIFVLASPCTYTKAFFFISHHLPTPTSPSFGLLLTRNSSLTLAAPSGRHTGRGGNVSVLGRCVGGGDASPECQPPLLMECQDVMQEGTRHSKFTSIPFPLTLLGGNTFPDTYFILFIGC